MKRDPIEQWIPDTSTGWVPLASIVGWDRNPNRHPPAQRAQLAASFRRFGFVDAVTIARIQDEGVLELRAGHGRVEGLNDILREDPDFIPTGAPGPGLVRALIFDFPTRAAADAYGVANNRLAEIADPDEDAVAAILRDLDADGFSLDGLGWEDGELEALLGEGGGGGTSSIPPSISLVDRFLVPPFTILDARKGDWAKRKAQWMARIGDNGESRENTLYRSAPNDPVSAKLQDAGGVSILDPVLSELICIWFGRPGFAVLDPFAGDSVFGFVAASLGFDFVGIELRREQASINQQRLDGAGLAGRYICDSAENVGGLVEDEAFDLIFSCPPYMDLEVYSDNPQDLSTMKPSEFFEAYGRVLKALYAKLRQDRFAVIVVGEVRDKSTGQVHGLVPRTILAMEAAGFKYWNELILVTMVGTASIRAARQMQATRKVTRVHQSVLVFYKGDQRNIHGCFGDVELASEEAVAP